MPEISQIGYGSNDYATWELWEAGEEAASYGGNPPRARVSTGTPPLPANLQIRKTTGTNWTDGFIIEAEPGEEFDGNFGGSHAVLDEGGFNLDIRVANGEIRNLELLNVGLYATGDAYDNLIVDGCGYRALNAGLNLYLYLAVIQSVKFSNTIILVEAQVNNQAMFIDVATNVDIDTCTILAINGVGANGGLYVRGTLDVNHTAVYSTSLAYEESGTPTVTGDYNAGSDNSITGANSVATLTLDDFVNFAARDLRIKSTSALAGAGLAGADIGAFVQPPSLRLLTEPTEFVRGETIEFSLDSPNIVLSAGNVAITSTINARALTIDSVASSGGTTYTVTATIPALLALKHSTLGYTWNVVSGVETTTTELIKLAPPTGWSYRDLVDPSTINGSILEGFTEEAPVTGSQVVYITKSSPSNIPFTVQENGEWIFDYAPLVNQSASRYVIQPDGSVGSTAAASFSLEEIPTTTTSNTYSAPFLPALGAVVTLAVDYADLHVDSFLRNPAYTGYDALVIGDQISYKPTVEPSGNTCSLSDDGLLTIGGEPVGNQTFDYALVTQASSYTLGSTATETIVISLENTIATPSYGVSIAGGLVPLVKAEGGAGIASPEGGAISTYGLLPSAQASGGFVGATPTTGLIVVKGEMPEVASVRKIIPEAGQLNLAGLAPVARIVDSIIRALPSAGLAIIKGLLPTARLEESIFEPVISLNGAREISIGLNGTFVDPGVVAIGDNDEILTNNVVRTGSVNAAASGTYRLSYNVADIDGNQAIEVTRDVIVQTEDAIAQSNPYLNIKKYFEFEAGETSNDIGWSHRSFSSNDLTSFGSVSHENEAYIYGSKVLGFGFSKSSALNDADVEAYFLLGDTTTENSVTRHISLNESFIELVRVFESASNPTIKGIQDGIDQSIIDIDFSQAIDSSNLITKRVGGSNDTMYIASDVATDPLTLLTVGNKYFVEVSINQQILRSSFNQAPTLHVYPQAIVDSNFEVEHLSTNPSSLMVFDNNDNSLIVSVSYKRKLVDMSKFSRFVLTAGESVFDTDSDANAVKIGENKGELILNTEGESLASGKLDTQLIAYSEEFQSGVVVWDSFLRKSKLTIDVLEL